MYGTYNHKHSAYAYVYCRVQAWAIIESFDWLDEWSSAFGFQNTHLLSTRHPALNGRNLCLIVKASSIRDHCDYDHCTTATVKLDTVFKAYAGSKHVKIQVIHVHIACK